MPKTKLNIIKPALGVTDFTDGDLLQRLNAVHDGMLNNPAYPTPPVDMPSFKAGSTLPLRSVCCSVPFRIPESPAGPACRHLRRARIDVPSPSNDGARSSWRTS